MVDIGVYNSCKHFCKHCYANFDEKIVNDNFKKHNPKSSLLIGELVSDGIIKERTNNKDIYDNMCLLFYLLN